jgi:hypothetical protein
MKKIPHLAFKIAADMIQQRLLPQSTEPADLPLAQQNEDSPVEPQLGGSVLGLLGKSDRVTAKEPAPKIVTVSGSQVTQ